MAVIADICKSFRDMCNYQDLRIYLNRGDISINHLEISVNDLKISVNKIEFFLINPKTACLLTRRFRI
jgi:hypothetical protein